MLELMVAATAACRLISPIVLKHYQHFTDFHKVRISMQRWAGKTRGCCCGLTRFPTFPVLQAFRDGFSHKSARFASRNTARQ